jgi:3-oxoadipate CoA-transferase beta subunit
VSGTFSRSEMAARVARDLPDGSYVNLGIGLPEQVADYVPVGREIVFHSENGILGLGPKASSGAEDFDLINAGKKPVTILAGGAYFDHAASFAMIRGRHIDVCVMGAFEVSEQGDLANWATADDSLPPAVGGAMDLALGARQILVMMTHLTKAGAPKLLTHCSLPLTARRVVTSIYTDMAVIDVREHGLVVRELAAGLSFEDAQRMTGAELRSG